MKECPKCKGLGVIVVRDIRAYNPRSVALFLKQKKCRRCGGKGYLLECEL